MGVNVEMELEARADRIREHTARKVNERITLTTDASIARAVLGGRDAIVRRIAELDQEWDVDRALMLTFSLAGGASFTAGFTRYVNSPPWGPKRKGFLYLFGTQLAFLFVHASVGWCPPLAVLRRFGFRTRSEIEVERAALSEALEGHVLAAE